jgi:hypothetical protein
MKQKYVFAICFIISQTLLAQQASINISLYNTGARFELRRAPFGSQKDILDSVKTIVFAQDTFEVKKNDVGRNFTPPTKDDIKKKLEENKPNPNAPPQRTTDAEKEKAKQNAAKRTCIIETNGLKGKIVLIDFDKNCDPADKCLQAQRAGAFAAIVIYDTNKKDSIAMVKSRVSDAVTIPCYSIIRQQGDSLRVMLPSKAAFFTPRPNRASLIRQDSIQNAFITNQLVKEGLSLGTENTNSNIGAGFSEKPFVRLSPNPSNDIVTLRYVLPKLTHLQIDVKNMAGQTIYTNKNNNTQSGNLDILTQSWTSGIYWVHISFGEERTVQKLVVQH